MEEQTELIDELIEKGHKYTQTQLELIKLKTLDKTADVLSNFASWLPLIIVAFIFFMMLNIGIALWLGDFMGQYYYGFLSISAFYILVFLIFWIFRKPLLKHPFYNSFVNQILNMEDEGWNTTERR